MMFAVIAMIAVTAQAEIKHAFVCMENGEIANLHYVDQFEPSNSWTVSLPVNSRDIYLVDRDKVLVSHLGGATLRSLKDGSELQSYDGPKDNKTVSLTAEGHVLMADKAEIVFASLDGKTIKKIPLTQVKWTRLARQLKNGNVMLSANKLELHEYDPEGKLVWKKVFKDKTYLVHENEDGSFYATTGGRTELLRIDRDGNETLVAGGKKQHPDAGFAWFSGFDVLDNENIVVANWCGHRFKGEKNHLFEFDKDNHIVWQWKDETIGQVTTVQIIK